MGLEQSRFSNENYQPRRQPETDRILPPKEKETDLMPNEATEIYEEILDHLLTHNKLTGEPLTNSEYKRLSEQMSIYLDRSHAEHPRSAEEENRDPRYTALRDLKYYIPLRNRHAVTEKHQDEIDQIAINKLYWEHRGSLHSNVAQSLLRLRPDLFDNSIEALTYIDKMIGGFTENGLAEA